MRTSSRATTLGRRLGVVLSLLGLFVGSTIILAPGALAHHPDISATIDCNGIVSFTSTAWGGFQDDPRTVQDEYELSRTNSKIQISMRLNNGSFQALAQSPAYAYNKANGYTFSDSLTLTAPLPATVVLKAQAMVPWANGVAAGDSRETSVLTLPSCPLPSAAIADANCVDHAAVVSLANSGNGPVTFTIAKAGNTVATETVQGGNSMTRKVPLAEDETATITVNAPGMATVSKQVGLDCVAPPTPPPPPTPVPSAVVAAATCDNHTAVVTLTNTGNAPVLFTVSKGNNIVESVTVQGGDSVIRNYPLNEDDTSTFTVSAPSMQNVSRTMSLDCFNARVLAKPDCRDDGAALTLTNMGARPATFTVSSSGQTLAQFSVPAETTAYRLVTMEEDDTLRLVIRSDGGYEETFTVNLDCVDVKGKVIKAPKPVVKGKVLVAAAPVAAPLPYTGSSLLAPISWAIALIMAGFNLMLLGRREERADA